MKQLESQYVAKRSQDDIFPPTTNKYKLSVSTYDQSQKDQTIKELYRNPYEIYSISATQPPRKTPPVSNV